MKRWCVIPLAISAIVSFAVAASAADRPVYKAAPPPLVEYGNLYFGVDLTSHGSLAGYAGVLYAPYGMNTSGLRLSFFGLYGGYQYDSGLITIKGSFTSVDVLIGYSFVTPNSALTLAIGPNFQHHTLSPADPTNPVQGSQVGLKIQGDYWSNPTPTTMLFLLASYSSAFHTYYALGRFGFAASSWRDVYFGPEIGALGNDRTDQVRLGIFLTGLKVARNAKLTFSTGYLHERAIGAGWYGTASIDFSF